MPTEAGPDRDPVEVSEGTYYGMLGVPIAVLIYFVDLSLPNSRHRMIQIPAVDRPHLCFPQLHELLRRRCPTQ